MLRRAALDHGTEEIVLAGEQLVDRLLGHPDRAGDLVMVVALKPFRVKASSAAISRLFRRSSGVAADGRPVIQLVRPLIGTSTFGDISRTGRAVVIVARR